MARYNKNAGYIGAGIQQAKGTAVVPELFIAATDATTLTPTMEFDQQNELGDGIYPGHTVKTLHKMDGSFNANAKADLITFLFDAFFGSDTISGAAAPYTHVIIPNATPANVPWITLIRDVAGQIKEEFTDCRIKELTVAGEKGNRITVAVSVIGLTSKPATFTYSPTYETINNMFMFYDGTYTKDGTAIGTISAFSITFRADVVEDDQTTGIELADAPVIGFTIETTFTLDVDATNQAEYDLVYYAGGAAATALDDGTMTLLFDNGLATTDERELKIELHKLIYTAQPLETDASSKEQLQYEVTAHCEKHSSNGLATITTKSGRLTGPAATRATGTLTFMGVSADTQLVTINSRVYEFTTDGVLEAGSHVAVDISGGATADLSVTGLAAAINADASASVTAIANTTADTVVVLAKVPGVVGNAYNSTTTCANASWGAATLAGGTNNG